MLFGDRRHSSSSRITTRYLRNSIFTAIMMIQVTFWIYIVFLASSSKSHKQNLKVDREERGLEKEIKEPTAGVPRILKPIPMIENVIKSSIKDIRIEPAVNIQPLQAEEPLQPQGGYLKDLVQEVDKKTDEAIQTTVEDAELDYKKYYNSLLHHTILYRNASIIWDSPFVFNPKTICSRHSDLDLLVIVHTAPYNFRRREMIRHRIANSDVNKPYTTQLAFMIGTVNDEKRDISKDEKIISEFNTYGDLIKMDFIENFRNLSLKAVMWLKWTNENCKNANMILKIDDDVVIDIQRILLLSRGLFSKYKRSIFCHLNKIGSQPIPRRGRTEVNPREFMRMSFYPYTYCSGFIVFLTPDIIPHLEETARKIPFYNVDDVFMFGMVPKFAGDVTYHNIGFNVSIWNPKVLKCTMDKGQMCQYFGTMGEEEVDRLNVWNAIKHSHDNDFHFPQMRVGH